MLRLGPILAVLILVGSIGVGLVGVALPSVGWLPAIGARDVTLDPWRALLAEPGIGHSITLSALSGVLTPLLSFAVVCLFLAGARDSRLYGWIRRATSPLLAIPHAAAAIGLAFLIAPSGVIARLISPGLTGWNRPPDLLIVQDTWGLTMMAGLIVKEIPFLMLMALAALPQIDADRRLAVARSLGYGPVVGWFKAVLPALYPLLRLPIFAVIAFASSTVDVALILGPTTPAPLAVRVVGWLYDPDLDRRLVASAGALLQLAVAVGAIGLWVAGEHVVRRIGRRWTMRGGRRLADRLLAGTGMAAMSLSTAVAAFGIAALALASVAGAWRFPDALPGRFTARHWQMAAADLGTAVWATAAIALLATAISLVLVLASLENEVRRGQWASRRVLRVLYLPLIVPQVAFMFGLVFGAESLGLKPGFWLVVLGHVIFVLPYVYLSLAESYRRLDPRWVWAARTLGAGADRAFWRVRVPMLLAPILTALAVGAAVSVGQYLPTQLLGAGRVMTLTTEAVTLAAGGDRRLVGVWALVQAAMPAVGFALALGLPRVIWRDRRRMREQTA